MQELNFNTFRNEMTEQDINSIYELLTYRCGSVTKGKILSVLTYGKSNLPKYGILSRIVRLNDGDWVYYAGQDYKEEIRTIRKILITGK